MSNGVLMITNCAKYVESIYRGAYWEASTPATTRLWTTLFLCCWATVYSAGPKSNKQWVNALCLVGSEYQTQRCIQRQLQRHLLMWYHPANTRCWTSVVLTLGLRLRRWANIKTTLVQHLMQDVRKHEMLTRFG